MILPLWALGENPPRGYAQSVTPDARMETIRLRDSGATSFYTSSMQGDPTTAPGDAATGEGGVEAAPLRWSVEARLRFLEARLFWEGRINRSDLREAFGVSVPQAAADFKRYQEIAPGNLVYDASARCYRAAAMFVPAFGRPDGEAWLREAVARAGQEPPVPGLPQIATLPLPTRAIDPDALRLVLAAIRSGLRLRLLYQSMARGEPVWREVTPLALASDGMRWHLRAWCHRDARWEDFVFPRMVALEPGSAETASLPPDLAWETMVVVRLVPASRLGPRQAEAVARDYAMTLGPLGYERPIEVRQALLGYFRRRLRLDVGDGLVEVGNAAEVEAALAEWQAPREGT